jgi:hypothetical protein
LLNVLAVAGGFAVAVFWMSSGGDPSSRLAVVTEIAPQGTARLAAASGEPSDQHQPTPAAPRASAEARPAGKDQATTQSAPARPAATTAARPARADESPLRTGGGESNRTAPILSAAAPTPAATAPLSGVELVNRLQRELRRVGCYSGDISGEWTVASRRAMDQFVNRVNASLPTDRPDTVLLALVQSQAGTVCRAGCPRGQLMMNDGRCVPETVAVRPEPQRAHQQTQTAATNSWTTTTAREQSPAAPVVADATRDPLPGRMAIGAPTAIDPDATPLNGAPPPVIVYDRRPPVQQATPPRPAPRPNQQAKNGNRMPDWAKHAFHYN